jgi:hypothetical protein
VVAFSAAIPLLTALILVNHQETFRRRVTDSLMVRVSEAIAELLAFVGVVPRWPVNVRSTSGGRPGRHRYWLVK